MYSKSKGYTDRDLTLTPPPGYDGSRFRSRSDGRDDSFPPYCETQRQKRQRETSLPTPDCERTKECECPAADICDSSQTEEICIDPHTCKCCEKNEKEECCEKKAAKENPLSSFIKGLGSEEILLIALIVLLSGNQSRAGLETVLILALLLCIS